MYGTEISQISETEMSTKMNKKKVKKKHERLVHYAAMIVDDCDGFLFH